jgi:hypothetical protein
MRVDWATVASTAVGGAVALIATVLAHRLGDRGTREREHEADRRHTYVDFLIALNSALAELRLIADGNDPHRDRVASQAMTASKVYETRERMLMSAGHEVLAPAEKTFQALVAYRNAIIEGARRTTPEYHDAYHPYADSVWELRLALRAFFGNGGLSPSDLNKEDWGSAAECRFCQGRAAAVS